MECCIGTVHLEVDGECGDFSVEYDGAKFRLAAINHAWIKSRTSPDARVRFRRSMKAAPDRRTNRGLTTDVGVARRALI
jgi:hypothetical protein